LGIEVRSYSLGFIVSWSYRPDTFELQSILEWYIGHDCVSLLSLSIIEDGISGLDVSGCVSLKMLSCVDSKLGTLDMRACPSLRWLMFGNVELRDVWVGVDPLLVVLSVSGITGISLYGMSVMTLHGPRGTCIVLYIGILA
jgi:hypothetical protein